MVQMRLVKAIALFSVTALLVGCGGGVKVPELTPVQGRVTLKGQPVPEAVVVFEPEKGALSTGATDAEGKFELFYSGSHKGAVPGQHKVRISKLDGEAGSETIPRQYNEQSQLTQLVSEPGPNDFTFDLK
jgi:hypothetical protein